jgi:hypothetical protein
MRKKKFACGWPTLVLSLLLLGTLMSAAMAAPAVQGQWSTLTNLASVNPIHAALLPNGKVLIIAGSGNCPPERALVCGRHIFGWYFPFRVAQLRDARARGGKLRSFAYAKNSWQTPPIPTIATQRVFQQPVRERYASKRLPVRALVCGRHIV